MFSDQEVIKNSRSLKNGPSAQREAIQEARARGIFDAKAHLLHSPMGKAIANGFPLHRRKR